MASVHILDRTGPQSFRVALHIAVPNTPNAAGVNWRTALLNSGLGGVTVLPDGDGAAGTISVSEKTSIQTGALYEVVEEWELLTAGNATAQVLAYLDACYTQKKAAILADLQARLNQFGRTRDVA